MVHYCGHDHLEIRYTIVVMISLTHGTLLWSLSPGDMVHYCGHDHPRDMVHYCGHDKVSDKNLKNERIM